MRRLAPVPLAIYHDIDGTTCDLRPVGTLNVQRSDPTRVVTFDPKEVFALAAFFQLPGVKALIERTDAERQMVSELGFQESQREEAEKIARGEIDP